MQILVTDPIADAGIDQLRDAGATVTIDTDLSGDSLAAAVGGVDALLVRSGTAVTAAVFDAADRLQFVGRAGIGVDNIDIEAATAAGVIVANAPDGNVRAAAEHTVAMLFAVARSIPQAHGRLHDGEWAKSAFLGVELNGKTLGIVGLGRVGQEVARRVAPLGMELGGASSTRRRSPRRSQTGPSPGRGWTPSPTSRSMRSTRSWGSTPRC
jgi:D-3-phosphoglycerate dehydrogenase